MSVTLEGTRAWRGMAAPSLASTQWGHLTGFRASMLSLTIEASHGLTVAYKAIPGLRWVDCGEGLVTLLF